MKVLADEASRKQYITRIIIYLLPTVKNISSENRTNLFKTDNWDDFSLPPVKQKMPSSLVRAN